MKITFLGFLFLAVTACATGDDKSKTALDAKSFSKKQEETKGAIVDVRTPKEFNEGHLQNAKNFNWKGSDFDKEVSSLKKSEPIFVYCRSGRRSAEAASRMRAMGFKEVYELAGGIIAWEEAGLSLIK